MAPRRLNAVRHIRTMPYPGFPTDAQPVVMSMAAVGRGTSIFVENIFENRYKHAEGLQRLGAKIKVEGKVAIVEGVEQLRGAPVTACDLRGGAALVVAGLAAQGRTLVEGEEHIRRGYEDLAGSLDIWGPASERWRTPLGRWNEKRKEGTPMRQDRRDRDPWEGYEFIDINSRGEEGRLAPPESPSGLPGAPPPGGAGISPPEGAKKRAAARAFPRGEGPPPQAAFPTPPAAGQGAAPQAHGEGRPPVSAGVHPAGDGGCYRLCVRLPAVQGAYNRGHRRPGLRSLCHSGALRLPGRG